MSPELLAIEDARKILDEARDSFYPDYGSLTIFWCYAFGSIEHYGLCKLRSAARYLSDQRTAYLEGHR